MSPMLIIRAVSLETGVPISDIKSKCKKFRIVYARTMAMHLIRKLCLGISLSETGDEFGKDHSNVAHSLKRHERLLIADSGYLEAHTAILSTLKSGQLTKDRAGALIGRLLEASRIEYV